VRAGIAYVPQGREAFPYLTVFENLRVVAEASASSGGDVIEEALDRFPRLRKILDRPAGFLSGGEAQQLAIARALVTRPRLLLLDEPTEGIQPSIILEIEDAIADLKMGGMSILLVEQYVDFAMRLADTYAVMDVGRIVAAGATATFERARMQQLMSV
jgi:urea transport system ATP-binding protein